MKIGVLSDTHAGSLDELSPVLLKALSEVDLIVHAGDMVAKNVLDGLKGLKEVRAVRGNMDSYELKGALSETEVFSIAGRRVGVVHGYGAPFGIEGRVREMFDEVD